MQYQVLNNIECQSRQLDEVPAKPAFFGVDRRDLNQKQQASVLEIREAKFSPPSEFRPG
jgi:hypothetical protein